MQRPYGEAQPRSAMPVMSSPGLQVSSIQSCPAVITRCSCRPAFVHSECFHGDACTTCHTDDRTLQAMMGSGPPAMMSQYGSVSPAYGPFSGSQPPAMPPMQQQAMQMQMQRSPPNPGNLQRSPSASSARMAPSPRFNRPCLRCENCERGI